MPFSPSVRFQVAISCFFCVLFRRETLAGKSKMFYDFSRSHGCKIKMIIQTEVTSYSKENYDINSNITFIKRLFIRYKANINKNY